MAAEIDHRPHLDHQRTNRRSCPELSFDNVKFRLESQVASISQILDNGSISFGRYASEPLAWEKWSVFPHDRCQEELEKFKNPGLVAQKRAYFEEYYKKIRAMKALQEEEDTESDACQDSRNSNTPVENNLNISVVSKDENNFSQILNPGNKTISNLNSALGGADSKQAIEGQQRRKKDSSTVKAGRINTKSISSSTVQAKQSVKMTSSSQMLSSASKKTSQKKSLVSSAINHKSNQPQKNVPGLQHKGTVASVRNKTKLETSNKQTAIKQTAIKQTAIKQSAIKQTAIKQSAIKQSEKSNPTLHTKITHKADNSTLPSKKSNPRAASNLNRVVIKVCTTAAVPNSSLAREKLVSSIPSVRARQMKPSTASPDLAGKSSTKPAVHAQSANLVSSSASKKALQLKSSTNPQSLVEKLPTKLPVNSQTSKNISKDNTAIVGLKNVVKRSANISTSSKTSQKTGVELGQSSRTEGGKRKEGKEKLSPRLGRDPKALSSAGPRKEKLSAGSGSNPKAVSSARPGKENLHSRLGRDPKAVASARPRKENLSSRLGRDPKAASSAGSDKGKLSARLGRESKAASSAGPGRDRKPVSSVASNIHKPPNARPVNKMAPRRSVDEKYGQREPR
ncbi:protein WVD2-like 7 isoform X2 [Melia azedarach]|uniref:Protein WVD2-like 7 isoform X2 n=1 Tax=Melia azedarach TaxID=155640 RepID=A0ACC1XSS9_MELAZ|nr:protein WVD2-like 7 isoform X2 [Melia azedarach]